MNVNSPFVQPFLNILCSVDEKGTHTVTHKSWAPGCLDDYILYRGTSRLWILRTDPASCHPSGTSNFWKGPRFLENLCNWVCVCVCRHTHISFTSSPTSWVAPNMVSKQTITLIYKISLFFF